MKNGHKIIHMNYIRAPRKVLIGSPCSFGQPIILSVAHMGAASLGALYVSDAPLHLRSQLMFHGLCCMLWSLFLSGICHAGRSDAELLHVP